MTPDQTKRLADAFAVVNAVFAEINELPVTAAGWSLLQVSGKPADPSTREPTWRTGCVWNAKESRDLVKSWIAFSSIETMAANHRRGQNAVRSHLQHLLYCANVDVILDELAPLDQA